MGVLAIDVGTSSIRGALYSWNSERISFSSINYSTKIPSPGFAEQNPLFLLNSLKNVIKDLSKENSEIQVIILDSALHSILGVSKDLSPLTPIYPWEDSRANYIVERLKKKEDFAERFYKLTGCPPHPMYPFFKILWLKENLDDFYKIRYFLSMKSYLLYYLTHEIIEDFGVASGSGLLNIHTLKWEEELFDLLSIEKAKLPNLVSPNTIFDISEKFAKECNLPKEVKVIVGSSDAGLSNLGSGSIYPQQMTIMIGTSGAVRYTSEKPYLDNLRRTWCYYAYDNNFIIGGAVNNGGNVIRWFQENFGGDFDLYEKYLKETPIGSEDLLFLPYLAGERSPYFNANMRGIILGLSLYHGKKEIFRSLIEGIALQIYSVYEALVELMGEPKELRLVGGFSKSLIFSQVLSDVLGKEIFIPQDTESSLLGSLFLAYKVFKNLDFYDFALSLNPVAYKISPNLRNSEKYEKIYEKYMRIYYKLKDEFL